ncbi:Cgr1 negative regulator [Candida orthopsilosis Co 90-125]|uniref:Cgr1 negative regulator n=1 Tax=Candida orthopsilosis (strain 90-125) TaxID=1136231 RepID=H8X6M2_CANO9|nr:Cgr1 negative regulator [Candida orthopsilosis Co 90-125]CCG23633.1 Cgr1 negative regulator [Candida orthopsilosis Co 90-125]
MSLIATERNIFPQSYRGRLTEGVTYDYRNNNLLWIDIIQGEVHRLSLNDLNQHEVLKWPDPKESIGFIALTKKEDVVLVAAKSGLALGDFKKGTLEYFFEYPFSESEKTRLRSNDGIIDPWGNLWIGVMTDFPVSAQEGVQGEGKLYRITPDLKVDVMLENTKISNGMAFNDDGSEIYWTDSLNFTIYKFNYDHETNKLNNKTAFIETKHFYPNENDPEPDGLVRAVNGDIYSAVFSTSTILHVNEKGELVEKIQIPAKRCTCVTIGGSDDDDLFVTTGHLRLDDFDAKIDADDVFGDLGGFLFKLKVGLKGQKKNIWGGKVDI